MAKNKSNGKRNRKRSGPPNKDRRLRRTLPYKQSGGISTASIRRYFSEADSIDSGNMPDYEERKLLEDIIYGDERTHRSYFGRRSGRGYRR
ncbi:MAG: hypothetical protein Q8P81_01960 [Nanoarchaeota archaeon]|nr:hypothetical protein [Nanoarchaeota archaeon]